MVRSDIPLFSIVTISYNQCSFLEEAIRSVLEQDYQRLQYIVVDPGSTDGSRELIRRYSERIDDVVFERDRGAADGLNNGFSLATGELLGFLNADDVLLPGALSRIAKAFNSNPKTNVISGNGIVIDSDGNELRRVYSDRYSKFMSAYGASILIQPSTFFRREAFERVGRFNIENRSNWDGELFVDMALNGEKFGLVPDFLSKYRVHSDSITGTGKLKQLHQNHRDRMFFKVFGRPPGKFDYVVGRGVSLIRKAINWKDTLERIRRGPVFGVASR